MPGTEKAFDELIADYIRLGLITSMDNVDEVKEKFWNPQYDDGTVTE